MADSYGCKNHVGYFSREPWHLGALVNDSDAAVTTIERIRPLQFFDSLTLHNFVAQTRDGSVQIIRPVFQPQSYGTVFPHSAQTFRPLDLEFLVQTKDGFATTLNQKYLGQEPSNSLYVNPELERVLLSRPRVHDMAMPTDIQIIDTMIGFPSTDRREVYKFLTPSLRDAESKEDFKMPAQYMFKDIPGEIEHGVDAVAVTLDNMDRYGVAQGLINVGNETRDEPRRAITDHPDRFLGLVDVDPRQGMDAVRKIRKYHDEYGIVAVSSFPSGCETAINAAAYYPVYSTCAELGLPIFLTAGVPGPRVPLGPQRVEYLDEICWFFPELTVVMRHGADPWTELAVKLMLKWPNLYYSTSAFAPKHYPKAIIDYANTRGADKVLYAGYFPAGLTYERIMKELPHIGLKDEVWPKFLRGNAAKILGLSS